MQCDGKYLESTCGDNVNENIDIKMDIHTYIDIRNIYRIRNIYLIIPKCDQARLYLEMITYIHSDSFVLLSCSIIIFTREI